MITLVQSFCRNVDYPIYNIVLPAILTFVIGWYVKSQNYSFRWTKLNPANRWLIALTVGYGFVYPIYNYLFCPTLVVGKHLINVLFLTQPLALALGFTLAPVLNKLLKLASRISIQPVKPQSKAGEFHSLISWPIAFLCLLVLYFLPNVAEVVKSLVTALDANSLLGLFFLVNFPAGLVGIYFWKVSINYVRQNPGKVASKVAGFLFILIFYSITSPVLGQTFSAVYSTYGQIVGWIYLCIGGLALFASMTWMFHKFSFSEF